MSEFNIEEQFEQIRTELEYDPVTGVGKASIRATARLANVSHSTLNEAFAAGRKTPSKLAKMLIQHGFNPEGFSKNKVPDVAMSLVVKYYAWMAGVNCNDYAKAMDCALSAVSVRLLIQRTVGETAQKQESIEEFVRRQLPDIPAKWEVRFEREFWLALENLYGLQKTKRACALFINAHIYNYFPSEVRERLDEINPVLETGKRERKQHQHFDGVLLEALQKHIRNVTLNLMKAKSRKEFKFLMRAIPKLTFDSSTSLPSGKENA